MSTKSDRNDKNGLTLLARDTPENRAIWGADNLGYVPIEPICEPPNCPHYHYKDDADPKMAEQTPIHFLIASFRDRLCPRTLHNAFRRAKNPHRVYIRLVDQSLPPENKQYSKLDDVSCWEEYCRAYNPNCQQFRKNVYTFAMDATLSKGPTDARSKLSAMILHDYQHGETQNDPSLMLFPVHPNDFCMETDSHMDFSDDWDMEMIAMFHRAENDYAVLSTYVTDISDNNKDVKTVPNLCMVTFTSTIRNWGTKECIKLKRPKLTNAMWGAGLSFHRCHAELNVPVDPFLDNVFDGEEGSRGIRFFTHGYDVYTPDQVHVTHDYHTHQSNPAVHTWNNHDKDMFHWNHEFLQEIYKQRKRVAVLGTKRVNILLGIDEKDELTPLEQQTIDLIRKSRYGLGTKRNLVQVREFTGINLKERKMEKNGCANLKWIPFEESEEYGIADTLSRGLSGEVVIASPRKSSTVLSINATTSVLESAGKTHTFDGLLLSGSIVKLGAIVLLILALLVKVTNGKLRARPKHRHE
jgi:hypothetical protein